ncbi:hypothetical protein [Caulobacter sp. 17J65-9]|uniref:hypothetical protein n=1 Tax=Caulobacter sp. 17J65-9 TaxID=2709382 RepID=UPI0013C610C7|nr:hypothetical protein [Caulobacter sp. 17J65-9]NEX94114.1 hypothetical protein [Caulobacter sp. 17J65-9]
MTIKTIVARAELETPPLTAGNLLRRLAGRPLKTRPTLHEAEAVVRHNAGPEPRLTLSVEGFTVVVDTPAVDGCDCEVLDVNLKSSTPR